MANQRILRRQRKDFPGINRSVSANDNPNGAAISRDGRRLPSGKFVRRAEQDYLFDYRKQDFEHTTDDDATPSLRLVTDVGANHLTYRSHRRKCVVLGKSVSTEYVFTGWVERRDSINQHYFYIERGVRSGLDMNHPQANAHGVTPNTRERLVFSTASHAGYLNDWIEFSMVMNAAKTGINIVVNTRETGGGPSIKVQFYTLTNLYAANFSASTLSAGVTIESDTDITRDVDIELDTSADIVVVWGILDTGVIRLHSSISLDGGATFGAINSYTDGAGLDLYAVSLLRATTGTFFVIYTATSGGVRRIYVQKFENNAGSFDSTGGATLFTVDVLTGGTDFYYGACHCVDGNSSGALIHLAWVSTARAIMHNTMTFAGAVGTAAAVSSVPVHNTSFGELGVTAFDLVAKDGVATIFYVLEASPTTIHKSVRVLTAGDPEAGVFNDATFTGSVNHALVVSVASAVAPPIRGYIFFATNRRYELNTSKRLSWIQSDYNAGAYTNNTWRYLHSDKGYFQVDDDHSADTKQVTIKQLDEPLVEDTSGTMAQILILQGDDNRLYKRISYHWMLLEGSRKVDNSGWNWVTVFSPKAQIWDLAGKARFNAGSGGTNQNAWYGWIDRYFFNNDAAHRWNDHFSALARPAPPDAGVYATLDRSDVDVNDDRFMPFAYIQDGVIVSRVTTEYYGDPLPIAMFFCAISLEYDGVVESQLRVQASNVPVMVGKMEGIHGRPDGTKGQYVAFGLQFNSWNTNSATRISQRVTAVNLYLGECAIKGDAKDTVKYWKVKRIAISQIKPTGEDAFANDLYEGTGLWTVSAAGLATMTSATLGYVDFSMWRARESNGSDQDNLGNSFVRYKSTGSGTEIYTKETFIPEGFSYSIVLQNEMWAAGVRLAGVTRTNRLMRSARKLGSQVTPDQFALSDGFTTIWDAPYDIIGLGQIGDDRLVVIGRHGIDIFDITGGQLRKISDIVDIGTDASGSVYSLTEGGIGNYVGGVVFKDRNGNIRIFDGYGAQVLSDPIRDDYDGSNYGVLTLNSSSVKIIYVPIQRVLLISYGTQVWVMDYFSEGFIDWRFANAMIEAAIGVDGELFFTDGKQVLVWPQAGTVDSPNPIWRGQDKPLPIGAKASPKNVWVDLICVGTTFIPQIYKDRGSAVDASATMAASTTQVQRRSGYLRTGVSAYRELALGFTITSPSALTALEVDSIQQEILIQPKRP